MSMQRKMLLFATALLLCGAPAFAQNLADLEATVQEAQAAYNDAVTAYSDSQVARQSAQIAVNDAKAERDRLEAERDATERGTPERREAQARYKAAVEVFRALRVERDNAQNAYMFAKYDKTEAQAALDAARTAYDVYAASPVGIQEGEIALLESRVRQLEDTRDALRAELEAQQNASQAELLAANAETETAQAERDALQAELARTQAELETTTEELKVAQAKIAEMETAQVELQTELTAVKDEMKEAEVELADAEADLETAEEELTHQSKVLEQVEAGCLLFEQYSTGDLIIETDEPGRYRYMGDTLDLEEGDSIGCFPQSHFYVHDEGVLGCVDFANISGLEIQHSTILRKISIPSMLIGSRAAQHMIGSSRLYGYSVFTREPEEWLIGFNLTIQGMGRNAGIQFSDYDSEVSTVNGLAVYEGTDSRVHAVVEHVNQAWELQPTWQYCCPSSDRVDYYETEYGADLSHCPRS